MLIDSHTHIDLIEPDLAGQIAVVHKSLENGIAHLIQISTNIDSFLNSLQLRQKFPSVISIALGYPPFYSKEKTDPIIRNIKQILKKKQICAIGEIGLDYYRDCGPKEQQISLFRKQLELALEFDLPVIIHNREADDDILAIIKDYPLLRGVMHCYSSTPEFAEKMIQNNFYISFAGNLTFKTAKTIQETAKYIPLDKILIESDAPYLTPLPHRGQPNRPWNIKFTAEYLAGLRKMDYKEICKIIIKNTKKILLPLL